MSNDFNEDRAEVATPGPFPGVTAEQEENYASALVREKDGYHAKVEACKSRGDDEGAEYYAGRAEQVEESLKALAVDAETPTRRAAKRGRRKPAAAGGDGDQ